MHRTYDQRSISRELAARLPTGSVLIGDVAPGLCLYNSFQAVSVIPGLCNDQDTLERFRGTPRYIVILDGKDKERWWTTHYPREVAEDRRIELYRGVERYTVGVYSVPNNF